ncbi:MAG: c-type cytochrome [Anaerolineales bacterium]|nr:c-type cytochrome [Anaerolineales bacterium]MDP2777928.1 c-type cytochrome [Anaerolineales bacterium]
MMKRRRVSWLAILVLILGAVFLAYQQAGQETRPVVINQTAVPPLPTLKPEKVSQGEILYAQYCAKCHGANLEGAANWKQSLPDGSLMPPPHDSSGHTWHHADELLIGIIENGGDPVYNSKMPLFKDQLSRDETAAILEFIKSKWGIEEREFQWWITVRPISQ